MIQPFFDDWRWIDLRVVAQRREDGQWHFHAIRAILNSDEPPSATSDDLPSSKHLFIAHENWEARRLREFISSIVKGELVIAGETIIIKEPDGQGWRPAWPSVGFWERTRSRQDFGIDFAAFVLQVWVSGSRNYEQSRLIDASLRWANPPWDGLDDLNRNFLGIAAARLTSLDSTVVDVIAPLGVRLGDKSEVIQQELNAVIETRAGISENEIVVSAIGGLPSALPVRKRCRPTRSGEGLKGKIQFPFVPSVMKVIALYRGVDVDRQEFAVGSSPRLAVMRILGYGRDNIETSLKEGRGEDFEKACSLLLQTLGLCPIRTEKSRDGPDIVAFSDDQRWLLVVECTEAEPDLANKLTKLATRAKLFSQNLKGTTIQPLLMTKSKRDMLNITDLEKAQKENIAIITLDEVPELLQMGTERVETKTIEDYIFARIPARPVV